MFFGRDARTGCGIIYPEGGMIMLRYRWFFFFALFLLLIPAFYSTGRAAVGNLSDFLPRGAKIVQVIADTAFDEDAEVEYLVLYSLRDTFGLVLLDHRAQNRYT